MAAVRHRENGFLPLPCPGQAEENYLDAAGADAGRCAGDRWGGGCQWHERWEESSSGPGGAATVSPPGQSPGPWPTGPGGGNRPPRATCTRASAAAVARLPTCAQHRRPRRANLRVAPPCAQHLKDLLGAGDDVVLGLAGKHVEEGGIACHPDDQIPVLFRMDLGVQ